MPAGRYRELMRLLKRSTAPDGMGGLLHSFVDAGEAWGDIRQVYGSTYVDGVQIGERVTHLIRTRWRAVTNFDHIERGAQVFRVQRLGDETGERREITIHAEEIKPEGMP
jgi:head-tail adaptor